MAGWWLAPGIVKQPLDKVLFELQAPSWTALSYLNDLHDYWSMRTRSKEELIGAGRDLARLNAAYRLRLQQTQAELGELRRLEELLDLPATPEFRYEVARVVRRDLDSWWNHIVIRKGEQHGIFEGAAVVYGGGVVGRVREVHAYTAVVELVSSPTFRVAAQFENDLRPVTYQGTPARIFSEHGGVVSNVPPDISASAEQPLRLITSRLGGVFPDGLTIGWVNALEPAPDGLFQSGRVHLDDALMSLHEVAVIIPLERDINGGF